LDPFEQYDDAELNDALRSAGLFALQNDMDEGRITLDSQIASAGGNLSVGQRQILALARAIIRKSKLLILDEGEVLCFCFRDSILKICRSLATSAIGEFSFYGADSGGAHLPGQLTRRMLLFSSHCVMS
jgi:hypothetical protein